MKKRLIFLGIVIAALALASCKIEKGGTIEVKNGSTYEATISIMSGKDGIVPVAGPTTAAANKTVSFSIEEDGTYTVNAYFSSLPLPGHGKEYADLSGGNKVSVTVTPTN